MASIDNLNFAVILDDKNFRKQIEADLKLAKDFNIQLSDAFDLRRSGMGDAPKLLRQYQQRLDALMKSGRKLTEEQRQERENLKQLIRLYQRQVINISNAEARQQRYARTVRETTSEMDRQSRYLSQMTNMIKTATSAYAAKEIISDMIRITGEFEMQRVALRSILQDMTGADMLYEKIQALAVESPFQFKDLISYTKQLAAFSVPLDELYDTTKMLADVSAGLGVGMDRLILAYGQIRSAAFLRGTEVRQLTEAGVPILEELRKKFEELGEEGVTVGDVFDKISARMVPFEMVKEVFEDMTSAGGMFYQMQEVQAQTLAGKISNLRDAYEVMFAEIGGKNERVLKGMVDWVRRLIQNYEEVGREIVALIATYGLYRVTLLGITALTQGASVAFKGLAVAADKLHKVLSANPYAIIAAAIAAMVYTVYRGVTAMSTFEKGMKSVNDVLDEFTAETDSAVMRAHTLLKRMEELEEGTDEYNDVRNELLRTYGSYLNDQERELVNTGDLATVYGELAKAIGRANAERYKQQAENEVQLWRSDRIQGANEALDWFLKEFNVSDPELRAKIVNYVKLGIGDAMTEVAADIADMDTGLSNVPFLDMLWEKILGKPISDKDLANAIQSPEGFILDLIQQLRDVYAQIERDTDVFLDTMEKGFDEFLKGGDSGGETPVQLAPWQEELQGFLGDMGKNAKYPWWSDEKKNSDWDKYVADIRGKYNEINKQIEDSNRFQDARVEGLKEERAELEKIAQFLGFDINPQSGGSGTENDQLRRWRIQVQWLQELQRQYQALSQYADNATLSRLFMGRYGEDINSTLSFLPEERRMSILVDFDFEDNLLYMASEIRKVGTDAALALAEQIERSVGGDWASVQEGLFKAVRDYADFIKEWGGQDFMLDGKGVAFDLSKIATDYNNAISKVAKTRDEAIKKAAEAAKKNGAEWYQRELAHIAALYRKQMDYEKKLRQEKVRELGSAYAKELIEANPNIRTDDFGDASFKQIRDSIAQIDRLVAQADNSGFIDEDVKKRLDEANISLEDFKGNYKEALKALRDKNASEYFKLMIKGAQQALGVISSLGGSIAELGKSINDADLERLGEGLQKAAQGISAIVLGFAQGGVIGGVIAAATVAIDVIVTSITEAVEKQNKLNEAAREYREVMRDIAREEYNTIFGMDEFALMAHDIEQYRIAVEKYNNAVKKANANNYTYYGSLTWGTDKHSALDTLAYVSNILGGADAFYRNGVIDMEAVKAYFEQVGDEVPRKQREVLEELIENYDYMNEQMGYMDEYLSSLFGNLASDIADAWMESWKNMADTAEDEAERMKDIFYDLGEAIVQSMVQSVIINTVLEKYTDQLKQLYTQYETSQNIDAFNEGLSSIFSSMKEDLEDLQPVIEDIYDNAEANDIISRDDYNSIDTIQGNLSEETMNRVLNIVNAMRAEQFRQGMRIDNIDVTLVSIAGLLGESRDQYLNYLAQISANTANTAERMQQWLDTWGDATTGDGRSGSLRVRIVN